MGDIPLMRAGFALMAVIAVVGGLSMVVLPEEDRDGDRNKDRDRSRAEAPALPAGTPLAAVVPPGDSAPAPADSAGAFACRVDGASANLPNNLRESSGLALATGGDALWTHNDSRKGVLHRVGLDGRARAEMPVRGAAFEDWEDIAAGPCLGGGPCLYLADIGDNEGRRRNITIYRMPEPQAGATQTAQPEALVATYPDGPQDAEALFVVPSGGIYVVTKGETRGIGIYELPRSARAGTPSRLELRVRLAEGRQDRPERITGAAASPDGQWLALRTVNQLRFYRTGGLASGQLGTPLTFDLDPLNEPQGEGVEFGPAGSGAVFLSSEAGNKNNGRPTLSRLTCTLPSS